MAEEKIRRERNREDPDQKLPGDRGKKELPDSTIDRHPV
jgi:hypothetical protein